VSAKFSPAQSLALWTKRLAEAARMVALRRKQIAAQKANVKPQAWHPTARRVAGRDAGPFVPGFGAKLMWHTTEGGTAQGAISAYTTSGSWPHFTLDPHTGDLFQHLPLNKAARALEHPPGTVETNRGNVIQVELVGYAQSTDSWGAKEYAQLAKLARWIERNAGVPRSCGVGFGRKVPRFTPAAWKAYAGHCGHEHAPNNSHWDPGSLRIKDVL
jgi:hypothetical protein